MALLPRTEGKALHPHVAQLAAWTAVEEVVDIESDIVAVLPLESRGSAPAYTHWWTRLRDDVARYSFPDGRAATASPLALDLADIVCGYVDALGAGATVLVRAPFPLRGAAELPARLTLGEAWAVMVDAFHAHRCRSVRTANADLHCHLGGVTFETVEGWELTDDHDVELKPEPLWDVGFVAEAPAAPPPPKRLPSMAALLQRPLGLFLRRPVCLEFNRNGRWSHNKFLSRDVLLAAACTLTGVSVHEYPPLAPYPSAANESLRARLVGVLPRGAVTARIPVLPNALPVDDAAVAAPAIQTVSAALQWMRLNEYVYRVADLQAARTDPAAPSECPLTGLPLTDAALKALNDSVNQRSGVAHLSVFDPATGALRTTHGYPLFHERKLELHGNWRVFCDKFLSPGVNATLERLGAAVVFEPEAATERPTDSGWGASAAPQFCFGAGVSSGVSSAPTGSNTTGSGSGGWAGWASATGTTTTTERPTGSGWGASAAPQFTFGAGVPSGVNSAPTGGYGWASATGTTTTTGGWGVAASNNVTANAWSGWGSAYTNAASTTTNTVTNSSTAASASATGGLSTGSNADASSSNGNAGWAGWSSPT